MPLQNRVDPWGALHRNPSRAATLMGNRGKLHDAERNIVRQWKTKSWIACDPQYQGIARTKPLFQPDSYSELFFLDEATALAAGHRPCGDCRRARYKLCRDTWFSAIQTPAGAAQTADILDQQLHAERVALDGTKLTHNAQRADLPDGVIFERDGHAFLVYRGKLWRWTFDGYLPADDVAGDTVVSVLTPPSIVRVLAAGYAPEVHSSAKA